jgi:hypothetical protein
VRSTNDPVTCRAQARRTGNNTGSSLRSARSDLNDALKEGDRGNTSRQRLLPALVVVEIALGLVLTTSAGLTIRTMSNLWSVNPGFDPQHVLTFGVAGSPAVHGTPTAVRNGVTQTIEHLQSAPGVTAASVLFGGLALSGDDSELPYWVDGRSKPVDQSQMDLALFYGIDADYLGAMRIPLLRGRFISAQDTETSPCAVATDEEFVAKAFPKEEALGRHINVELHGPGLHRFQLCGARARRPIRGRAERQARYQQREREHGAL